MRRHIVGALAAAALAAAGSGALGDDTALLQDERNTIEVFRKASLGVVHVGARAAAETKFEKKVIEAGTASGFFIDAEGRVLTNAHVVDGKNEIDVVLGSGRRVPGRLVGTVPQLDLALLQVDVPADELYPLPLGDSRSLQVGQKVLAIGNPLGLHNTLTAGVVSALNRTVPGTAVELRDALIQTDAAINPGNGGGPLLNSAGEVVGVNALGTNAQSLGFAIPVHLERRVMADLIEMGHAYRPQLGFSGVEITSSLARLFGQPAEPKGKEVSIMTEHAEDGPDEARHGTTCRVCLKPIRASDKRWSVHYRGAEYQVCCPSCVQAFNRAPRQFVEEP